MIFIDSNIPMYLDIVDDVIEQRDVLRADEIVRLPDAWSAREAIYLSIMERYSIRRIMSFDRDFDRWPGLTRIQI